MRIYREGETVRLVADDSVATVVEVHEEPYELPPGQAIGGPASTHGGGAWYKMKTADGKIITARDRDVRNPPKKGN